MPAPAVIPAPRAYLNAVAVKGFVVELRAVQERIQSLPPARDLPSGSSRTSETDSRERTFPTSACHACRGAPEYFTVTKKARPKQSLT